jgi:hypothetical protein
MSIAYTRIETHSVTAQFFIQAGDKSLAFAGTDMPGTVTPHPPVANGHQIAAKSSLSFVNGNAHAMSLNGAPTTIVYSRVIA